MSPIIIANNLTFETSLFIQRDLVINNDTPYLDEYFTYREIEYRIIFHKLQI